MPFASFVDDEVVHAQATCDIDDLSTEQKCALHSWHSEARDLLSVIFGKTRILSFGDRERREPFVMVAYKKENPSFWRIWLRTAKMKTAHHSGRTMYMWAKFAAQIGDSQHVSALIRENIARREELLALGNRGVIDELRAMGNLLPYINDPIAIIDKPGKSN